MQERRCLATAVTNYIFWFRQIHRELHFNKNISQFIIKYCAVILFSIYNSVVNIFNSYMDMFIAVSVWIFAQGDAQLSRSADPPPSRERAITSMAAIRRELGYQQT